MGIPFNPALLRLAREARGFTQAELARRSGIGQGTISKYEKELVTPSEGQIQVLSEALDFPPRFFADPQTRPAAVLYRSRTLRSAKLEAHVRARLNLTRLVATSMLEDVEIDVVGRFPDPDSTFDDPETAAAELRRAWSVAPGPIDSITALIELAGGVVVHCDFGTDKAIAAYMHPLGDPIRWFFVNSQVGAGDRVRFSLAHELGHAVLHETALVPDTRIAESESNRFAGALLMPAQDLRADLPRGQLRLEDLIELKRRWGVSAQALAMRARQIEAISADQLTRIYREISYRGWRTHEPVHIDVERPTVLQAAVEIHRQEHDLDDKQIAYMLAVSVPRLQELMPAQFPTATTRTLRVVPRN
jgi:Zn-dependent peptidase ImmA (M78 family)/transcriptional regulator with XRE-family HTH domain